MNVEKKTSILLVEDEENLHEALKLNLELEGYEVTSAMDGADALKAVQSEYFDLIIMDVMLPEMDGITVTETVRISNNEVPILILSAKNSSTDRVLGLKKGADDYLTKPFAMKEFLARVRAMTRRKTVYAARKLKFGDFSLDSENFELACENSMRLSVKEFELLQTLVLNSDHEVDTDYLLEHVWEGVDNADGETVWLYISYLRGKLKSIASNVLIEGERDGNYRLVTEG